MLSPLPLTPFEKMMVYDDRPGYPLAFSLRCNFIGRLDRVAVKEALEFIADRHPLLRARVQELEQGLCWVWDGPGTIPVHYGPWDYSTGIDPFQDCGVRLTVGVAERSSIHFEFHHSSCDGDGAGLFIRDFLKAYHEARGGAKKPWGRVDFAPLLARGQIPWPKSAAIARDEETLSWWKRLKFAFDFLTCLPEQVVGDRKGTAVPRMFSSRVFEPEETAYLLKALSSNGSNFNDVALTLLFQTLARWQERRGIRSGFRKVRVLMPTSIRRLSDRRMGAANRTSFAFLTRQRSACLREFGELFNGINQENLFIKRSRPDLDTLVGIGLAAKYGLLKLLPLLPVSQSSAILTNMGDRSPLGGWFDLEDGCLRVGDVLFESVSGTPPIRAGTRLALATGRVAERMSISLRCDPTTFSIEAEQEFLERYVEAWQEWAENET